MNNHKIGIDLGGTKLLGILVDKSYSVLTRKKINVPKNININGIINTIIDIFNDLKQNYSIERLGLAVPGPVIPETGSATIVTAFGWKNVPFKGLLEEKLNIPVLVENDVNMATLAEFKLGVGSGVKSLYTFYPGTGIGGGYIEKGKLVRGTNGTAGEVGHMVVDLNGEICKCGQKGCLETIVSNVGFKRIFKETQSTKKYNGELNPDDLSGPDIATAYQKNDSLVRQILIFQAEVLGIAIANIINITGVERIVIGGEIYHLLENELIPIVRNVAVKHAIGSGMKNVEILLNQLGPEAPALGVTLV